MNNQLLDQLTEKVLSGEMSLELACFKYITQDRPIKIGQIEPDKCSSAPLLVTTFEVIQPI